MGYIIGFFRVLKDVFLFILGLMFLALFFFRVVEWGLEYKVVQPKADKMAYEITSFAEANEVVFTDDLLSKFVKSWKKSGWIKDNEEITIRYVQFGNDKRFRVNVTLTADYWDHSVRPTGSSEMNGINWGEPPRETVRGEFPPFEDDKEDKKQVAEQKTETEEENQENANVLAEDEKTTQIEKISHDSITAFISHYVSAGISAIDQNDFSLVQDLLDPTGKAYKESKNYIKHMNEKGIQQELLDMDVTKIVPYNSDGFKVFTTEEYRVIDSNETIKIKRYQSEYHLVLLNDGKLALRELVETNLLSSAEVDRAIYNNHDGNTDFYDMEEETVHADPAYIYEQACASCHGGGFEGGVGPELYSVGYRMDINEIKYIIMYGQGSMPPMLDEREAEAMAAYLVGLQQE
ncbi:c-type cytochrome [Mesobacillus selenatarsenatis]|uniref:Cytochrome c n=1 Tax=Mesobacillus selenatarsenatis TaxID=388741 RepID=A0A846TSE8_9BACI|nr:cytochrome c [Mesobacillus selenatarsenatis]NKE04776.1 cytochrome c [Mesobacillus selenatarsenatis]